MKVKLKSYDALKKSDKIYNESQTGKICLTHNGSWKMFDIDCFDATYIVLDPNVKVITAEEYEHFKEIFEIVDA